jgi:hypothetical protein
VQLGGLPLKTASKRLTISPTGSTAFQTERTQSESLPLPGDLVLTVEQTGSSDCSPGWTP